MKRVAFIFSFRLLPEALFVLWFLATGWFSDMRSFPMHTHAWTQADQYALALGFTRNGLDFFHPETYVLNPQYPGDWEVPGTTGITAADFPVHSYLPAVFMKLSGNRATAPMRWYVLAMAFLGLYWFWRVARSAGLTEFTALAGMLFMASLPVFLYYQNALLVTIPALAVAWAGLSCWLRYRENRQTKTWAWALVWLTLAALSRTTFLLPLMAVGAVELISAVRAKRMAWHTVIGFGLSALAIGGYAWHNASLRAAYGSSFLSELMPPRSIAEAKDLVFTIAQRWGLDYLSWVHWLVLLVMSAAALHAFFSRKRSGGPSDLALLTLFSVLGSVVFFIAMMRQFADHDYYFLDAFAVPLGLTLLWLLRTAVQVQWSSFVARLGWVTLVFFMFQKANEVKEQRNTDVPWDRVSAAARHFEGSDLVLDSLGISRQARILVIDACAPNLPFIRMDRKGYPVMTTTRANIARALQWPFEAGVYQNAYLASDILSEMPEFQERIEIIKQTPDLTFFTVKK